MAKISGKQQQDMMTSVWKLFVTVVKVAAFNIIVSSIIPSHKYLLDQGQFQRKLSGISDKKASVLKPIRFPAASQLLRQ